MPVDDEVLVPYIEDLQIIPKDKDGNIVFPVCTSCSTYENSQGGQSKSKQNMKKVHTVDVYMTNHEEISGFQFRINNFYIDDIIDDIGTAAANDFYTQVGSDNGVAIGFSVVGNTIPAGSGILLRLSFSGYTAGTLSCINNIILSDISGGQANVSDFSDQNNNCITIE